MWKKYIIPFVMLLLVTAVSAAEKKADPWYPWKDPNNPNVMILDKNSADAWSTRRDTSQDPKREPGLINVQRYTSGLIYQGFPTFFGLPIALNSADLKAAKVDVAIVGLVTDENLIRGAGFAANKLRTLTDYMYFPAGGTDQDTRVEYFKKLRAADYGNISSNFASGQKTSDEIRKTIGEILSANALPVAVGGTHVQFYGMAMALADKYGPENIAVLHFDAHYDAYQPLFGIFVHDGSMIRAVVDNKIIRGNDIIQIGLRSIAPDNQDLQWMRENKLEYHFMAEIEKDGFKTVMNKIMKELKTKGKKVYISVDVDAIDPAYAPAVGTQEPNGLTPAQVMQMLRAVAIQNDVVAIDFIEYNPLMDDRHETTGILVDRLIRSFLAGVALKKMGVTDPYYLSPETLNYKK